MEPAQAPPTSLATGQIRWTLPSFRFQASAANSAGDLLRPGLGAPRLHLSYLDSSYSAPFLDPDDFNVVLVRVILIFDRLRALHPTLIFWQAQYEEMADGEEFSLVRTPGENPLGWLLGLPSGPGPPLDPGILTWIFAWRSGLLLPFTVWKRWGTPVLLFPGCYGFDSGAVGEGKVFGRLRAGVHFLPASPSASPRTLQDRT